MGLANTLRAPARPGRRSSGAKGADLTHKPRRFDLSPDNFIAGIAGQLSASDLGVYWVICLLIYSAGGPIKDDRDRIGKILANTHGRTINTAIDRLEKLSKITLNDGEIDAKGCRNVIESAVNRVQKAIENGKLGGRPSNKNNDLPEPNGSIGEKLLPPSPPPPSPPSKKESSLRSDSPKRKSKRSLPDIFPLEPDKAWAQTLWLKHGRADLCSVIDDETAKFRDHHSAKLTCSADWSASWRTWATNAIKFNNGGHNGKRNGKSAHDKFFAGVEGYIAGLQ